MKKWSLTLVFLLLLVLSACNGAPSWELEVTQEPAFIKDKETQMFITVTEGGEPVTGLDINVELAMVDMDHGTVEAKFEDLSDGTYATKIDLPMAGKWEAVFELEKDGEEAEKVIELQIEDAGGVAAINGEWITKEDVNFYRFINDLHLEMARETDREKYTGQELEDALAYWDSQEKVIDNQNMLVSQIIRLRAMAMLGEEKGHQATEAEVNAELEKVRSQYEESEVATQMIAEYGEDRFWAYQQEQYKRIVLTQKVQDDVVELVKQDNPNASEQEIQFNAQKKYEELLVSQVESLDIVLL
ncbi:FixH family protein [Bacillus sp. B15-48]|uniref:FixH family protein n=1 Tax=Bacillus sp. B15-48 TaxID=1548601 RepID=UPI001940002A|nr:FixH family protein [Bacillus sp. B15-48]MBM4761618.1 hypothetical protein [Bacillus sp. B15-48]